jgi:hypothetical protein
MELIRSSQFSRGMTRAMTCVGLQLVLSQNLHNTVGPLSGYVLLFLSILVDDAPTAIQAIISLIKMLKSHNNWLEKIIVNALTKLAQSGWLSFSFFHAFSNSVR